jgi:hypothetical protein
MTAKSAKGMICRTGQMLALRQHLIPVVQSMHLGERQFHANGDQHRAHGPVEPVAHAGETGAYPLLAE